MAMVIALARMTRPASCPVMRRVLIGKVPEAQTTSAGSLGGAAACVPSLNGRLAECVWADDDTFGVVASQTLSAPGLANELRQIRPMVEHQASSPQ